MRPVRHPSTESRPRIAAGVLVLMLVALNAGCAIDDWSLFPAPTPPPGPVDSLILRGDRMEAEKPPVDGKGVTELAGAHEFFRQSDYTKAEKLYHKIAENKHNSPQVAEEARYYEAECLRLEHAYPKAADTYNKLLIDFPNGVHREEAIEHKFEIANYWLDDTRAEIERTKQKKENWTIHPVSFVHVEKEKPLLDEEGRALEQLDQVTMNDFNGRRADEALFLAGSVKFYREDYTEADHYFSQLVEMHPNSRFASQAVELAIMSKHMSTGGSDYDGRKVAEARKLVDTGLRNYPDLAAKKTEFLERQLAGINYQQAEKDFKIAEFYRHTGHPGAAYFYYEIVRRRYPGTPFFNRATERMGELRQKLVKEGKAASLPPAPTPETPKPAPVPAPSLEVAPPPRLLPASPGGTTTAPQGGQSWQPK